ncbi:UPF0426 protein At1g28150, chloroplastic-like [Macadamia integrifolia]|uniref:UPF0426 protein At1g28150, chloroplastic-like n=1 Tax=Macadamia integrifolia TaxID=60698 RepID=UPI001C4F385F|nr:UPF0426 protein At1g28150, chloroplastic-like [Macadamia integrifolia]
MALFLGTSSMAIWKLTPGNVSPSSNRGFIRSFRVKSFFNPAEEPILKEALKEPVAFMGGMFAGLLRLDLNEDPLKEWITRTVESSGIAEEEIDVEGSNLEEAAPQPIEIE